MENVAFGLLGAGGFAREVMPYVEQSVAKILSLPKSHVSAYFVETWEPKESVINRHPVISLEKFLNFKTKKYFNVAVGSGMVREAMVAQVGNHAESLAVIAPQVALLESNAIGEAPIFCPNTIVTSNAKIGKFFQCNIYSYVAHDCVIGDFVTFAPSVRCNGRVHIEDHVYIGTNAIIREGTPDKPLTIGSGAVVGMGAVVTRDVPAGATVVGNPARILEKSKRVL